MERKDKEDGGEIESKIDGVKCLYICKSTKMQCRNGASLDGYCVNHHWVITGNNKPRHKEYYNNRRERKQLKNNFGE